MYLWSLLFQPQVGILGLLKPAHLQGPHQRSSVVAPYSCLVSRTSSHRLALPAFEGTIFKQGSIPECITPSASCMALWRKPFQTCSGTTDNRRSEQGEVCWSFDNGYNCIRSRFPMLLRSSPVMISSLKREERWYSVSDSGAKAATLEEVEWKGWSTRICYYHMPF